MMKRYNLSKLNLSLALKLPHIDVWCPAEFFADGGGLCWGMCSLNAFLPFLLIMFFHILSVSTKCHYLSIFFECIVFMIRDIKYRCCRLTVYIYVISCMCLHLPVDFKRSECYKQSVSLCLFYTSSRQYSKQE
jgi:hypothetical protein